MIAALIIGRGGSRGLPNKNLLPILGRPLMTYPILAAQNSQLVDRIFLSSDSTQILEIGKGHGIELIKRPFNLATDDALVEDVLLHGYEQILKYDKNLEFLVVLFCNSATIQPGIIDEGIRKLRKAPEADSAVTVSKYNEYSPVRAKRISNEGYIVPYVDLSSIDNISCDRDSAETCYFCDCSVWVLRPSCLLYENNQEPFKWMGKTSIPLFQEAGLDIDFDYGVPQTEFWLRKNGFSKEQTPYDSLIH